MLILIPGLRVFSHLLPWPVAAQHILVGALFISWQLESKES
jgi:hypothetical protein